MAHFFLFFLSVMYLRSKFLYLSHMIYGVTAVVSLICSISQVHEYLSINVSSNQSHNLYGLPAIFKTFKNAKDSELHLFFLDYGSWLTDTPNTTTLITNKCQKRLNNQMKTFEVLMVIWQLILHGMSYLTGYASIP